MKNRNYFEILEFERLPTPSDINDVVQFKAMVKKAYRKCALKYHPDREPSPSKQLELQDKMQIINEAYEKLINDSTRTTVLKDYLQTFEIERRRAELSDQQRQKRIDLEQRERDGLKPELPNAREDFERKVKEAHQIVENGGYHELDQIQKEYEEECRKQWEQNWKEYKESLSMDEDFRVKVKWKKQPNTNSKLNPEELKKKIETVFGSLAHFDKLPSKRVALVEFENVNDMQKALLYNQNQTLIPNYLFQFSKCVL